MISKEVLKMEFILNFELMIYSGILILVFMIIDLFITSHFREKVWKSEKAQEEKDSLVRVIDKNLLKGYHEQSLKHKEAKEKMKHEDERMEASIIIDVVFYWNGYIKALEELKDVMAD